MGIRANAISAGDLRSRRIVILEDGRGGRREAGDTPSNAGAIAS
jgi:hypothetical protein